MNTDNLPPLPEPALVIGTKLLPYEERHFSTQDLAVRLGYREGIRSYYTTTQVEEIRRAAILAERERWKEEIEAQEEKYFVLASELVYNGNSVQHWCSKAKAYGDAIMQCWDVLKEAGRPPDGKTQLHEAIAAAIRENS